MSQTQQAPEFFVHIYNDVFDQEQDLGPFYCYDDAARFADRDCCMFDHVLVMCPHDHSGHCPHNCHEDSTPTIPTPPAEAPSPSAPEETHCPQCAGTGVMVAHDREYPCRACHGTGNPDANPATARLIALAKAAAATAAVALALTLSSAHAAPDLTAC
jgi:hypothetical protein